MSFLHRVSGLTLRDRVRTTAPLCSGIWAGCIPDMFLLSYFGHIQMWGDPGDDQVHTGGITYPMWSGNASESPRKSCGTWLRRRTLEWLCLACHHHDQDSGQKMHKWSAGWKVTAATQENHLHPSNHHRHCILLHCTLTSSHSCHGGNYVELVLLRYVDTEFKGNDKMLPCLGRYQTANTLLRYYGFVAMGTDANDEKEGTPCVFLKHSTNTVSIHAYLVYGRSKYRGEHTHHTVCTAVACVVFCSLFSHINM